MNNIDNTQEELFSLNFELQALSDLLIRGEAERWVPKFMRVDIEQEHSSRYQLALKYVSGKKVLDLACGSGYGTYLLAEKGGATEVLGGDIDRNAIRYGNHRYPHPAVKRIYADAEKFRQPNYYDVVVSFETIEHLPNHEQFLQNIAVSLKDTGVFLVSTPIVANTTRKCVNPYHVIEWNYQDFHSLIKKHFDISEIFVQNIELYKPQPGITDKVMTKVRNNVFPNSIQTEQRNMSPEPFTNQYPIDKIVSGYQVLVCRKKGSI